MTKRKNFTDPRARHLVAGAYAALALTAPLVCFLGSVTAGAGGEMFSLSWAIVGLVAVLAVAALAALIMAPRVEAEAIRLRVARQREYLARLAARSAMPPADPTPVSAVPSPTGPILPPPLTTAPAPAVEPVAAPAPVQPAPVQPEPTYQPAPLQAQ